MGLADLLKNEAISEKIDDVKDGFVDNLFEGSGEKIVGILKKLGPVPEELAEKIMTEKNKEVLAEWLKKAVQAENIEQFMKKIQK